MQILGKIAIKCVITARSPLIYKFAIALAKL